MALNFGYGYEQPTIVNTYPPTGYYGGGGGGLFGGNGNGDWLGVLFLIALLGGGWGNGFGGNGGGNYRGLSEQMQQGFDHAATSSALSGLQNSVTTGFSSAEVANCGRAIDSIKASYDSQIANMGQNFNNIRDLDSRLDGISTALGNCCCENRQAIADVKYAIANDGAATRQAIGAASQQLMDKICQLELDGYKQQLEQARRDNQILRDQVARGELYASQLAQTKEIENFVRPPINPSYQVPNPYAPYSNCNCGACGNVIGACA